MDRVSASFGHNVLSLANAPPANRKTKISASHARRVVDQKRRHQWATLLQSLAGLRFYRHDSLRAHSEVVSGPLPLLAGYVLIEYR